MKRFFKRNSKTRVLLLIFSAIIFTQALVIAKLYSEQNNKNYTVNLVEINREKDSIDIPALKENLKVMDNFTSRMHTFLRSKGIENTSLEKLVADSLQNAVYLNKSSNRYSKYLVDLETNLQHVPLGMPTEGYISSFFGKRKNPIPNKKIIPKTDPKDILPTKPSNTTEPKKIVKKDSTGKIIEEILVNPNPEVKDNATSTKEIKQKNAKNHPPSEAEQMQFHKGIDIAVAYGSDVHSAATGKVIFADKKGGYGNCIIISHGNGLATLYAHLSQILVQPNDMVKVNQIIAKSGNSGRSTGPHLHYEVHKNNTPVNPKLFMNL